MKDLVNEFVNGIPELTCQGQFLYQRLLFIRIIFNLAFMKSIGKPGLFALLLLIVIIPFIIYKINWLAGSEKAIGKMGFKGKTQTGQYVHNYSVIFFKVDTVEYWFNGLDNVFFKEGEQVTIRYSRKNPYEAKIDSFVSIWGDTLVYGGIPIAILIVVFLHPHIIRKGSRFIIQKKMPFIQLME